MICNSRSPFGWGGYRWCKEPLGHDGPCREGNVAWTAPPPPDPRHIHQKYQVTRTDGSSEPGGKHEGCAYFVLDLTHDEYALDALKAYAKACRAEKPELAADIGRIIKNAGPSCNCREVGCPHSLGQAFAPHGADGMAHEMMADPPRTKRKKR